MKTSGLTAELNHGGQIMNMSAPPRSTVTINTCSSAAGKNEAAVCNRAGLEIKIKINRDHNLRRNLAGCFKPRCTVGGTRKKIMAGLLMLSRIANGEKAVQDKRVLRKLMQHSMQFLLDEYMENVGLLKPLALDLPAFAMARSGNCRLHPENNPARMLAVFSRTTNGIFIASRLPVRPDCTSMSNPRYLLFVPG
jgi:hypothetical protein